MTHEKEGKEKSGKKVATKTLKEKRADKAAKRNEKGTGSMISAPSPFAKSSKK